MSRADSTRAARIADALLQSISIVASCRHRRSRITTLARWGLALGELGIDAGPQVDELRELLDARPISRAIAGDLDPDLGFVDRLDAVSELAWSHPGLDRTALLLSVGSDQVREACLDTFPAGVARRLRVSLETGVMSFPGTDRPPRFIGVLAPGAAERYPASVALAQACARRCLLEDRPDLRRRLDAIAALIGTPVLGARALARYAAGDTAGALALASSVGPRSARDRALLDLAGAALGRGDVSALARFTRALDGARAAGLGGLLRSHGALRRGRLSAARRELGSISHPALTEARDHLLGVCDLARATRLAVPHHRGPLATDPAALAVLIRVRRGLRRRDLTAAVELMGNPLVTDPRLVPAIAAEADGHELHRVLRFAHVAGGQRARSAWAAALFADRLRVAWSGDRPIAERRIDDLRAALGGAPLPNDPRRRATFDEAIALGRRVGSRVGFCRAAVRAAGESLALVESRARALALVGGGHAINALYRIIERNRDVPAAVTAALRALLVIDPRAAVDHLLTAAKLEVMAEAEAAGVLEPGFAERWCSMWAQAERRGWTGHLLRAVSQWRSRHGRLPPRCLLVPLEEVVSSDPASWSAEIEAELQDASPDDVIARLQGNPKLLIKAVWTRAPVLPASAPAWNDLSYAGLLANLERPEIGAPGPGPVTVFARLAGGRPRAGSLARALLLGACPGTPVRSVGDRRRLRFVDKRRDLLEHLRFADVIGCCFTSSSEYYTCECHATRTQVLRLWRDPLSFVFVIEEARARRWELRGFVFGSFGVAGGSPVALLNGIYAHVQTAPRRRAILEALEDHFVGLGVHRIAIANEFAGHGWLPANYHPAPLRVERLRALVDRNGVLHRDVYDDIGGPVNEPASFDHLYWSPRLRRRRRLDR